MNKKQFLKSPKFINFHYLIKKLLLIGFVALSCLVFQGSITLAKPVDSAYQGHDKKEIIIKYKDDSNADTVKASVYNKLKLKKLKSKQNLKNRKMELISIDDLDNLDNVVEELQNDPNIEYAQPNYLITINALPNDPSFGQQWGLSNSGQTVKDLTARTGVDINALKAWAITTGSPSVLVGVLDTGIDVTHADLRNNIYLNTQEIAANGIDDDGNGYIDDVNGWNFADGSNEVINSSDPTIDIHGTEVAGIIAASANNALGVSGVAPNIKILPLKFITGNSGYTSDAIAAIDYASSKGVKIINCSFAGSDNNLALKDTMQNSDILFICSAGNTGNDVSQYPVYPACFGLSNVLSVAAIDGNGVLSSFSNYGDAIDVAAPGVNILTTTPGNNYDYASGTSTSAPFVTGIAALVLSNTSEISIADIKAKIKNNVVPCTDLNGKVASGGRVDANAALTNMPPSQTDTYSGSGWTEVNISGEEQPVLGDALSTIDAIHYGESGVNPATKNYSFKVKDMTVSAPGFQMDFTRTYNSKMYNVTGGPMGRGWTFSFAAKIDFDNNVVRLPDGSVIQYYSGYELNHSRSTLIYDRSSSNYLLTTKDQYRYCFNIKGRLIWMKDRNENTITIDINNSTGHINHITDPAGRIYTVTYDGKLIQSITDPLGRTVNYKYDVNSYLLLQVTDPMGKNMYYNYDNYRLTNIMDNDHNVLEQIESTASRVTKATDANGDVAEYDYHTIDSSTEISEGSPLKFWKYNYDRDKYITEIQDPEGKVATTTYTLDGQLVGGNSYVKYHEVGSTKDRYGNTTTYDRYTRGNVCKITNPDGSIKRYGHNYENNLDWEQDEAGKNTFNIFDPDHKNILLKIQPLDTSKEYFVVQSINNWGGFRIHQSNSDTYLLIGQAVNGNVSYSPGYDLSKFAITTYTYYTDAEALQLGYKAKGLLKTVVDPVGGVTTYTYDANGNATTIKDPEGNVITNHYNTLGWKDYTIAGGFRTNYFYNKNGQLEQTTLSNGETTRIVHDAMGRIIQEISPNQYDPLKEGYGSSNVEPSYLDNTVGTRYTYTISGLIKTVTDALNNTTSYTYDVFGNKLTETKPNGSIYSYKYDIMDRVTNMSFQDNATVTPILLEKYSYTNFTDLGKHFTQKTETKYLNYMNDSDTAVTVYTYDYAGRLISQTNQDGGVIKTEYNANGTVNNTTDANGFVTYYIYDGLNRLTKQWTPGNASTPAQTIKLVTYDPAGRVITQTDGNGVTTHFEYNGLGKVAKMIRPGDASIPPYTVTYQYDALGNLKYQDDSMGKVDEYTYDPVGRQISHTQKKKNDNSEVITESVVYDKNGNKRFVTKNGVTTENQFDALNRMISTKIIVSGVAHTTSYTYDESGNQLTVTDWLKNTSTNKYDKRNRLIEIDDANEKFIKKLEYNRNSTQSVSYDALNNATRYTYDKNDRLISTTDPENHITSQTYDYVGNIKTKTDGRSQITTYTYDGFNRLIAVVNPKTETTTYTYDLNGNTLTQKDGKGNVTTLEYNVANKVTRKIDQGGRTGSPGSYTYVPAKTETYTYYADGSLAQKVDRKGNTTTYIYDIHGRLRSQAIGQAAITYTYDNNGNQLTMTDSTGITTRTYDELNRTSTKTVPGIGPSAYAYDLTSGVDAGFRKETTTDPKGNITSKVYDKVGRLSTVTADGQTTTYTYDDNGNRQSVIYPGGSREDYTYYRDNLNKTLINKKADGTIIDSYSYTYDGAHNQTSKTDSKGQTTYTYDSLNRLESVTDPSTVTTYTYDPAGNRLSETVIGAILPTIAPSVTTNTYNEQNRLITSVIRRGVIRLTYNYIYDNNGNMLKNGTITNEYDVWNQLAKTTSNYNTITYTYSGDGLRSTKTVNGAITKYLYENDNVVLEVDGSGTQTAKNVYGTNLLKRAAGGNAYYYMYNGHGDVTALLDSTTGGITGTYYYDAFGNILEQTGTVNNNTTYAGYQWDAESGLYYLNARYYDPKIARFLSEDTILGDHNDPLSLNLYTYCHNEPIMYMDPTGHYEIEKDKDGNTYAVINDSNDTLGGIAKDETGNAGNWGKIGYGGNERNLQFGERINISGLWGSGNSAATQKGTTTPPAAITGTEGLKSSAAVGTEGTRQAESTLGEKALGYLEKGLQSLDDLGTSIMISDPIPNGSIGPASFVDNAAGGIIAGLGKGGKFITKALTKGDDVAKAANKGVEQVLDTVKSYEQARNQAFDIIGDIGADSKPYIGRLGTGEGRIVGRQSADGKVRWRLDYDPEKGPHINVEDYRYGKGADAIKIAIPFEGGINNMESLLMHLNK